MKQAADTDGENEKGALVFVLEKHDLLREKIAGVVSRNKKVAMTTQLSDCRTMSELHSIMKPDLLIMNANLARFCEAEIARVKQNSHIPVLMFSDQEEEAVESRARKYGADFFIKTRELPETVTHILSARARRNGFVSGQLRNGELEIDVTAKTLKRV